MSYNQLDNYLEGKELAEELTTQIEERYVKTEHKRHLPVTIYDQWWKA